MMDLGQTPNIDAKLIYGSVGMDGTFGSKPLTNEGQIRIIKHVMEEQK